MKSKALFSLLTVLVFGLLFYCGYLFRETDMIRFFLIEGITLFALILFILLYRKLIEPYQLLTGSMQLLKEQDFSVRLRPVSHSEANKIIEVFNKMMEQLKNERLNVREKNHFLDLLIQASPQGVILLDFDHRIKAVNPSGLRLLNMKNTDDVTGKKLSELPTDISQTLALLEPKKEHIIRGPGIAQYRCIISSFMDRGFSHPFILIEELTHELMSAEKKSYESIIRMIAHEVNNSMGAISATLNVISDIAKQDKELEGVQPALSASYDRCLHLSRFICNFADVVKIPQPLLSRTDINELARSVSALTYTECRQRNINLRLDLTPDECITKIDSIQFEQVILNIIKNAYEAIGSNGIIRIVTRSNPLSIHIENNGPEITPEIKQKLFTPFFTTKVSGQGIGLMFVREVLLNHNCPFEFRLVEGWTKFDIYF